MKTFLFLISLTSVLSCSLASAAVQMGQGEAKWEIEVHAGTLASYHTGGSGILPPPGQTYSTSQVTPSDPGATSRRVSSWYFGDGADLFNFAARSTIPHIVPLDPVLTSSVVQPRGAAFGFRASRQLVKWAAAEFTLDRGGRPAITGKGLDGIEKTRAGFETAWTQLVSSFGPGSMATSVSTVNRRGGYSLFTAGVITINAPTVARVTPFVTIGAGLVSSIGNDLSVLLVGKYIAVTSFGSGSETDTLSLRYGSSNDRSFVQVVGGGAKFVAKPHWGIRFDIRAYLYRNAIANLLDANHSNSRTTPGEWAFIAFAGAGGGSGGFMNGTDLTPNKSAFSSLSGPPISGFKTFAESGIQSQIYATVGPYWRF